LLEMFQNAKLKIITWNGKGQRVVGGGEHWK
jgi:hypothetical protein